MRFSNVWLFLARISMIFRIVVIPSLLVAGGRMIPPLLPSPPRTAWCCCMASTTLISPTSTSTRCALCLWVISRITWEVASLVTMVACSVNISSAIMARMWLPFTRVPSFSSISTRSASQSNPAAKWLLWMCSCRGSSDSWLGSMLLLNCPSSSLM